MDNWVSICKDNCQQCPLTSCNFNPRFDRLAMSAARAAAPASGSGAYPFGVGCGDAFQAKKANRKPGGH